MKDARHHIKHLQRKVIQSARKAEAEELTNSNANGINYQKETPASLRKK